jgi:hypothetical protein
MAGEQLPVDGTDLMRQRLDQGEAHGKQRVEQVRQADPPGFPRRG